jgi:ATP-dependent Zn protease
MNKDDKKDKDEKVIKTTYKDKDGNKYEIEVKVGEKKEFTSKDKKDAKITVEGKEKGFFKNKFTVNNEEKSTWTGWFWGLGVALPITVVVLLGAWFFLFRKKKNKHEEEAL